MEIIMNRRILIFAALMGMCGPLTAQVLYEEHFTGGQMQLKWSRGYSGDSMLVLGATGNPSGDGWIGAVAVKTSGGGVGLAFSGTRTLSNYSVEAQIYASVQSAASGSYNGLVACYDTSGGGNAFYSLLTDFDSDKRIRLRKHMSASSIVILKDWTQISVPAQSGWVKLKLTVSGGKLSAYYNDTLLTGSPFSDTTFKAGYFGIYAFNAVDNTARTLCDDIVVKNAATYVREEQHSSAPEQFALSQNYPNPFNPDTRITYRLSASGFTSLSVHDQLGRRVRTLISQHQGSGDHAVVWDGTDDAGNVVPSGMYFYTLKTSTMAASKKMVLMK